MEYTYNTPEEAIRSLEKAYDNKDLEAIINSKDFKEEAKLILEQTKYKNDLDNLELIYETAELLKLSLIKSIKENGFPDFSNLKSEIFNLEKFRSNIYVVNERITYPDGNIYETRIFLSFKENIWKIALVEE